MIEIGKRYKNIHTGYICKVRKKIFYNIQYIYMKVILNIIILIINDF